MPEKILDIQDLVVWYKVFGGMLKVLNGVNFTVFSGEKVGLVGETGCGKTTTMKTVLRILPKQAKVKSGSILFRSHDVLKVSEGELSQLRGSGISMIFQDPTAALNPVYPIGTQISDTIRFAGSIKQRKGQSIRHIALAALKDGALPDPERIMRSYPFQLSGGMRQRVCIAMALSTSHELLIADEPTTNLDVTIQDQVLRLIRQLVANKGLSLVLITHSLGVAREMTDRIYVMYAGYMVETAATEELFDHPLHPYTLGLLESIPKLTGQGMSVGIAGRIPNYFNPPMGCRFQPRCLRALPLCATKAPPSIEIATNHAVACFLYENHGE